MDAEPDPPPPPPAELAKLVFIAPAPFLLSTSPAPTPSLLRLTPEAFLFLTPSTPWTSAFSLPLIRPPPLGRNLPPPFGPPDSPALRFFRILPGSFYLVFLLL